MSLYQVSGDTLVLSNDGNAQIGNVLVANSWNSITGSSGPVEIKISNSSTANVAEIAWIAESITYDFADVSGTTGGSGANATFNVTVTNSSYQVSIVDIGESYQPADTITIAGTDLGGASPANDLTVTVGTVDIDGGILTITSAGTQLWPQGGEQTVYVMPGASEFIQVNATAVDTQFTSTCDDGNVYITPVNVVQ